jgi:hypothetical protein
VTTHLFIHTNFIFLLHDRRRTRRGQVFKKREMVKSVKHISESGTKSGVLPPTRTNEIGKIAVELSVGRESGTKAANDFVFENGHPKRVRELVEGVRATNDFPEDDSVGIAGAGSNE